MCLVRLIFTRFARAAGNSCFIGRQRSLLSIATGCTGHLVRTPGAFISLLAILAPTASAAEFSNRTRGLGATYVAFVA